MDLRREVHAEGLRRINALTANLPPESAVKRALAEAGTWSTALELQATSVELLDAIARQLVTLNHLTAGRKPPRFGEPFRFDHPDRPSTRERRRNSEDAVGGLKRLLSRVRG